MRHTGRLVLAGLCLVVLAQGCALDSLGRKRLERYRPDADGRSPWLWEKAGAAGQNETGNGDLPVRSLRRGDKVSIYLRGIPAPEEVIEVIDDLGSVSLPLVGLIDIVGLTTAEAEKKVRDAYVESGYYTEITVIVVAEEEEYFVRGEVKQEGRYALSGDRTLLQAITTAGGYTDYAKTTKVKVIRHGQKPLSFNLKKIERRQARDPLIEPGDVIIVPRRLVW